LYIYVFIGRKFASVCGIQEYFFTPLMQLIERDILEESGHLAHPKAFTSNISRESTLGGA